MRILKKTIAVIVLLLMGNFYYPKLDVVLADQLPATKAKITEHEPKGRKTIEIASPKKSGAKWLWALVGVAAIGGVVAAAGGGDNGKKPKDDTGSFESAW